MNRRRQLLALLALLVLSSGIVGCGTQIPSGARGVFYSKFGTGTQMGKIYKEGFVWHLPWNSMFIYKIQLQQQEEHLTVLSSDGATITMDVSILYHPQPDRIDSLQVTIGPDYYRVYVAPSIRGIAREVAGRYKPEEIYSTKRAEMNDSILTELRTAMLDKFITIENVVVRDVTIPAKISDAINAKLTMDQEAQQKRFELEKEKIEADRKRIEAQGIADYQKIINAGLTPALLKWKGIEATLKIAESPNTKVVMVGNNANGLPVILGSEK